MKKVAVLLAAMGWLAGAGSASGQTQLTWGGIVGAGGQSAAAAGHGVVGFAMGGPLGMSNSTGHVVQGGMYFFNQSAGIVFLDPLEVVSAPEGIALPVTVSAIADAGASFDLFYRFGGSAGPFSDPVAMTAGATNTYTGSVPGAAVGPRGLEIYVQATQNGVVTTLSSALAPYRVRTTLTNHLSPTPPDGAFKMIGFPFDVTPATVAAVFEDDLGARDDTQWKLGRWDEARGYLEYSNVGDMVRGKGYWLAVRHQRPYGASGQSALPAETVNGKEYARLELSPGWNQISTPFAFTIAWADRVEPTNGFVSDALYAYLGSGQQYRLIDDMDPPGLLQPFEGYWVENTSTVKQVLYLPYLESPPNKLARDAASRTPDAAATPDAWRLDVALVAGSWRDDLLALGAATAAEDGRDALDFGKPPCAAGEFLELVSEVVDAQGKVVGLAGDFRAPADGGWRFHLLARGNVDEGAHLEVSESPSLPAGFVLALVDPVTNAKYILRPGTELVLPRGVSQQGVAYELLVGEQAWVEAQEGEQRVIPERFAMRQNYPNPFNPRTTIRLELPSPSQMLLEVFDARGRRVGSLINGMMPAGTHFVVWDGCDDAGSPVASGLYFYRVSSAFGVETRRMMLLK